MRRSLSVLAGAELPVAVCDRVVSTSFARFLEHLPGFAVAPAFEPGLVPQVKTSLAVAADLGRPFVLYTEPDKEIFFRTGLQDFLQRAPADDDVGIVIAARSDAAFATFPPVQRYTEGVINHLTGEALGVPGDYSYGPFLVHAALVPAILKLDTRLGWGWRHAAFLTAHRHGRRVVHLSGEYPCPPEQREEDAAERVHRLRQLSQNILGLTDAPG